MATKRSYDDGCAAAHALNLVGERWALLIARELLLGPKRFTDLRTGLPGLSAAVLAHRLEELERSGVLRHRRLPPPAAASVYELTEWGAELEPVITALGRWGARSPALPRGTPMSADSLMLSLRTMFDARAAAGVRACYELRFGHDRFRVAVADGALHVERGSADAPDAVIEAAPELLAALAYDGRSLAQAQRTGEARVEGDKAAAKKFFTLFVLPAPAAAAR